MIDRLMAIKQIAESARSREEIWCQIIDQENVSAMAEVGVYRGLLAENLLQNCVGIKHYTMIDPWRHLKDWNKPSNASDVFFSEIYEDAMQRTRFAADKIKVLRAETKQAVKDIPDESLDLAYIDGDHTLRGITLDLMSMFDKIKPGGIIGGDDFNKSIWQHGPKYDPTFVCPYAIYFAEAMNVPILALPRQQFLIVKDSSMGFELVDLAGGYKNLRMNQLAKLPE